MVGTVHSHNTSTVQFLCVIVVCINCIPDTYTYCTVAVLQSIVDARHPGASGRIPQGWVIVGTH